MLDKLFSKLKESGIEIDEEGLSIKVCKLF